MNKRGDAGLYKKWQNGLTKGTPCPCMGGIELLDPVFCGFTDAIDHGGLADARGADQKKCRMGAFL